jgi:hypothetical protein
LDDLKETRGYWKLKEEAMDGTLWRTFALEEAMDLSVDYRVNECMSRLKCNEIP